jgi:hypothetical protein
VALARSPFPKGGYTHYHSALTIDRKHDLHVAYDIYWGGKCNHAGYMKSTDDGRTWRSVEGDVLNLPVTTESGPFFKQSARSVRVQNVVCDSKGNPWICMAATFEGSGPQLFHHDGRQWSSFFPTKRVTPPISPAQVNGYMASLTIDSSDRIYLAGLGTGAASGQVVVLYSTDKGESFRLLSAFPRDPRLPHAGLNFERPTGHHQVDVPWLLFSTGQRGSDTAGKGIFHIVHALQLGFRQPSEPAVLTPGEEAP